MLLTTDHFLIFVALFALTSAKSIHWNEVTDYNDFLLVSLSACDLTTETDLTNNTCPAFTKKGMSATNETWCENRYVNIFFPHDPMEPPKLLIVYRHHDALAFRLEKIFYPVENITVLTKILKADLEPSYFRFKFESNLVGVLYDSHSHQLYLLVQSAYLADHQPLMNCEVFNVDMNGKKIVKSHEFKVGEVFLNSQWSSDPYNQKFYYYQKAFRNDIEKWELRSIPFNKLEFYLKNGIEGALEKDFVDEDSFGEERRSNVQVANGILYFTANKKRFILPLNSPEFGVKCNNVTEMLPLKEDFLVITGWDYCKLRDGRQSNKTACELATKQLPKPHETVVPAGTSQESSLITLWIIIGIVVVNVIILGIMIVVVCFRQKHSVRKVTYWKPIPYHPDFAANPNQSVDF